MEFEKKDFFRDQYLQFHGPESQTKNYQLNKLNQISECIFIIKNSGELGDIVNSLSYILHHIGSLEFDDCIEIAPYIQNYALDFENIELSAISIHILSILIKNDKQGSYELIQQEFIQNAIEKSAIIFSYCQGLLSPQICDLIFSFIKFSNETIIFSLDSQLIHAIVNNEHSFHIEDENLDQVILHLRLILNITKLLSDKKELSSKIYELLSDIYKNVSQAMGLKIPQLYDILLKIYDAIFRTQPELNIDSKKGIQTYNSSFEPLFDDFFHNYASILNEDRNNKSFFLNILLNFSKASFAINILKKYPIYDFIIPYLRISVSNIDDDPNININTIKLSWEIIGNFIFEDPEQVKIAISNGILQNAIEICQEGTINMKCSVIKFLSNILCCAYDQLIFECVKESNLLEVLLILVECLPIDYSGYIIMSVIDFIKNPKISLQTKIILKEQMPDFMGVHSSLTCFAGLCSDDDLRRKGAKILEYLDDESNENLDIYCEEQEDEEEEEEEEAEMI